MLRLAAVVLAALSLPSFAEGGGTRPLIPVAVLVPASGSGVPEGLALAIAERVGSKLIRTQGYAVLHPRQVLAAAERNNLSSAALAEPGAARALAEKLGARTFASARLSVEGEGLRLRYAVGRIGEVGEATGALELPKGEAVALEQAASALAAALAERDGLALADDEPASTQDSAVRDYAVCAAKLIQQPIGIENPTLLAEAELAAAVKACEAAVKADPAFARAWAALALASAIAGDDTRAIEALGQLKVSSAWLANAVLARFWLVSRYQSDAAAEVVLNDTVAREPGQLLTRTYLAEYYGALGRWADAARAWQAFAALVPKSPFALSRLAWALARLGKVEEAAVQARAALAFDPQSPELLLELASRQLDAKQLEAAEATLAPLLKAKPPRAEVLLRAGYLKLAQGKPVEAKKLLESALGAAKDKRAWRTRARARLDLAQLAFAGGDRPQAKKQLLASLKEGLAPSAAERAAPEGLWSLVSQQELEANLAKGVALPKEASPLAAAVRPAAPKGFERVAVPAPAK